MHRAPIPTLAERFERRFARGDAGACWVWNGGKDKDGYGLLTHQGRTYRATRLAWTIATGVAPQGREFVCHHCDNPPCVNPNHLFLGDVRVNSLDMMTKKRWRGSPTTKLSLEAVQQLRAEHSSAFGENSRLARKFGISTAQVSKIMKRQCWADSRDDEMLARVNAMLTQRLVA